MAELKTQLTKQKVGTFIATVSDKEKQKDAKALLALMKGATGMPPKMWGTSIIGFGMYHYKSERSSQEGDWPLTGFSPRKQNLTVYIMPGFSAYEGLLKKLGKYKKSVGCLYINKLSDVDTKVLAKIVQTSVRDMRKKYNV